MQPIWRDRLLMTALIGSLVLLLGSFVDIAVNGPPGRGDHLPLFMAVFFSGLITLFVVAFFAFRIARRPDCPWSRPVRYFAQAPGWALAAAGAVVLTVMGIQQLRAGQLGLGSGFIVAVVFATIKGISMALQNARQG